MMAVNIYLSENTRNVEMHHTGNGLLISATPEVGAAANESDEGLVQKSTERLLLCRFSFIKYIFQYRLMEGLYSIYFR